MNRTARLALLALASLALPACGGDPGDPTRETESGLGSVYHGTPLTAKQLCKIRASDAVTITSFDTGSNRTANGIAYAVLGDPLSLTVNAYTNWPSYPSGPIPVQFDGVSYTGYLTSTTTQFAPSTWQIVTASTPVMHTFYVNTSCGPESATMNITIVPPTVPQPVLTVTNNRPVTGTATTLIDGALKDFGPSSCLSSGRLTGRNVGDHKVVLDEPMPTGFLISSPSKGIVKPVYDTEYTITEYCRSNHSISKSASVIVTVAPAQSGGGTVCSNVYSFCMQCPEGVQGFPPQPVTVTETACGYDEGLAKAKLSGSNCSFSDNACP